MGQQSRKGKPAVADGEFDAGVEVGHGLVQVGEVEERVVAEAGGA